MDQIRLLRERNHAAAAAIARWRKVIARGRAVADLIERNLFASAVCQRPAVVLDKIASLQAVRLRKRQSYDSEKVIGYQEALISATVGVVPLGTLGARP